MNTRLLCRIMVPALLAALVSGCIRSDSKLVLNADGSAEFEINYSMAEQAITQLRAVWKLRDDLRLASGDTSPDEWQDAFLQVFADPTEARVREELAKYEPYGVTAVKVDIQTRNAWRYAAIKVKCADLASFGQTHLFKEYGFTLTRNPDDTYLMARDQDCMDAGAKLDFNDPETASTLGSILAGFNIRISAQVPGRIISNNASRVSLYSADWDFDFNRNRDAMEAFQNHRLRLQFQGKGLNLPALKQE
jgi:hypothetical protein